MYIYIHTENHEWTLWSFFDVDGRAMTLAQVCMCVYVSLCMYMCLYACTCVCLCVCVCTIHAYVRMI